MKPQDIRHNRILLALAFAGYQVQSRVVKNRVVQRAIVKCEALNYAS